MSNSIKTGSVAAAGAALNISLGWTPEYVKVVNVTDGSVVYEWFSSMTDGAALRSQNVVDTGSTGNASLANISSNGVSKYAGSSSAAPGFTIGSAIAVNGKTLAWLAVRGQDD